MKSVVEEECTVITIVVNMKMHFDLELLSPLQA